MHAMVVVIRIARHIFGRKPEPPRLKEAVIADRQIEKK